MRWPILLAIACSCTCSSGHGPSPNDYLSSPEYLAYVAREHAKRAPTQLGWKAFRELTSLEEQIPSFLAANDAWLDRNDRAACFPLAEKLRAQVNAFDLRQMNGTPWDGGVDDDPESAHRRLFGPIVVQLRSCFHCGTGHQRSCDLAKANLATIETAWKSGASVPDPIPDPW